MSSVSFPINRPARKVLLVANASCRHHLLAILGRLEFPCTEVEDPYAAMVELCNHPTTYGAMVLSLMNLYSSELSLIPAVRKRFPHLDIWLAQTDGRQSAMAEALRLGANGMLTEEGPRRTAISAETTTEIVEPQAEMDFSPEESSADEIASDTEFYSHEPVLTPEELRALLQEQPLSPPGGD